MNMILIYSDYDLLNFIIGNVYAYNRLLVVSTFVLFPKNGMLAKLTYIFFGARVETTNRCIYIYIYLG